MDEKTKMELIKRIVNEVRGTTLLPTKSNYQDHIHTIPDLIPIGFKWDDEEKLSDYIDEDGMTEFGSETSIGHTELRYTIQLFTPQQSGTRRHSMTIDIEAWHRTHERQINIEFEGKFHARQITRREYQNLECLKKPPTFEFPLPDCFGKLKTRGQSSCQDCQWTGSCTLASNL